MIREARYRAGLSQEDLAQRLGTSQPVIARWETNRRSPMLTDVIKSIRACGQQLNLSLESRDTDHEGLILRTARETPEQRLMDLEGAQHFSGPLRGVLAPSPDPAPKLHVIDLIRELHSHRVRYVLIGMVAAKIHCSPYVTDDLDICPSFEKENLYRLWTLLGGIAENDLPEFADANEPTRIRTTLGDMKIVPRPAASRGYGHLLRGSAQFMVGDIPVRVAGLREIIASKQTLNRSSDRVHLIALRLIRQMQETGELELSRQ